MKGFIMNRFKIVRMGLVISSAVAASVVIAACGESVEVGTETVNKDELQTNVQEQLTKTAGQPSPPIVCPDTLDAKVGSTTTCTLTDSSGTSYNVAIKVTSVDGETAKFDVQVADTPNQ
jgi:hypothetical protein